MDFSELARYDYHLPPELIRKQGIEPRDTARLFVYDTAHDTVIHDTFSNLANYLPAGSLVVLNETRVVPARLILRKETGGKIEVFVLANEALDAQGNIPVLVDRKCVPGMKLSFPDGSLFEVVSQDENRFFVRLVSDRSLSELLDLYGETPIPHYLEDKESKRDEQAVRKRYQTVFARSGASVAAPTASLHFTDRVFESFADKGIETARVGLDVGQGTFAPLREENFLTKKLHHERISVSEEVANRLNRAKSERRPSSPSVPPRFARSNRSFRFVQISTPHRARQRSSLPKGEQETKRRQSSRQSVHFIRIRVRPISSSSRHTDFVRRISS